MRVPRFLTYAIVAFAANAAFVWLVWLRPRAGEGSGILLLAGAIATGALIAGLAYALLRLTRGNPYERAARLIAKRPASFSFVLFHGEHQKAILPWLNGAGFDTLGIAVKTKPYSDLIAELATNHKTWQPDTLWMATYCAGDHTVLVDNPTISVEPTEEVVRLYAEQYQALSLAGLRFADDLLARFCREQGTVATVASWDRITGVIVLRDLSWDGQEKQTVLQDGKPSGGETEIQDPALRRHPDVEGLKEALANRGIDTEALFAEPKALILKLQSRGKAPTANAPEPQKTTWIQ